MRTQRQLRNIMAAYEGLKLQRLKEIDKEVPGLTDAELAKLASEITEERGAEKRARKDAKRRSATFDKVEIIRLRAGAP
jgi:hypothetical protein